MGSTNAQSISSRFARPMLTEITQTLYSYTGTPKDIYRRGQGRIPLIIEKNGFAASSCTNSLRTNSSMNKGKMCGTLKTQMGFADLVEGILEMVPEAKQECKRAKSIEPEVAPKHEKGVKHQAFELARVTDGEGRYITNRPFPIQRSVVADTVINRRHSRAPTL